MRHYNIPIFVPHIGCTHNCVFCNQKKITGKNDILNYDEIEDIIEKNIETINSTDAERYVEIAFFGGSFTAIDEEVQNSLCEIANKYLKMGKINGIRCSTRPDAIDEKCLERLKNYGFTAIELGVQSTDDEVLKKSGRGHTAKDVFEAAKLIKQYGFSLGLQMMLGLVCDTKEKMYKTADDIISLKPDCVRIYPTLVISDTPLFDMMKSGKYTPLSLVETVDILAVLLEKFYEKNINVIRVGLQTTDEVNENTVTGPYHPAIREMAESTMFRQKIEKYIAENKETGNITVFANSKNISAVSGYKQENKRYFRQKYSLDFKVKTDNNLNIGEIKIVKN